MLKNLVFVFCFVVFVVGWALYVLYAFVSLDELPGPPPEPPDLTASDFEPIMEDIGDHRSGTPQKWVSRMNCNNLQHRQLKVGVVFFGYINYGLFI